MDCGNHFTICTCAKKKKTALLQAARALLRARAKGSSHRPALAVRLWRVVSRNLLKQDSTAAGMRLTMINNGSQGYGCNFFFRCLFLICAVKSLVGVFVLCLRIRQCFLLSSSNGSVYTPVAARLTQADTMFSTSFESRISQSYTYCLTTNTGGEEPNIKLSELGLL